MKNSSNRLIFPTFVCMEGSADKIFEVLKRYWGFTEFRPVQERIIRSAMAGAIRWPSCPRAVASR